MVCGFYGSLVENIEPQKKNDRSLVKVHSQDFSGFPHIELAASEQVARTAAAHNNVGGQQ